MKFSCSIPLVIATCATTVAFAHPGHSHRQDRNHAIEIQPGMEEFAAVDLSIALAQLDVANPQPGRENVSEIARTFEAFSKLKAIRCRTDEQFFYIESNGIPDHRMMVGITAWQQQVPLPQNYFGGNAWRIPRRPVVAKSPMSTKNHFLRGAIAVAANGIPIFNPLNNRGDDAFLAGELDEFGGHCGRADDYHYHLAPVHLEKSLGKGLPIAYALDGYPIYGYEEPDGSKVTGLDLFNGHHDKNANYHYHATKEYPYLNGGFHGEVIERDGQVDPQPRVDPIRPDGRPLRDAKITDFVEIHPLSYQLTYEIRGKKGSVSYTLIDDGSVKFDYVDPIGGKKYETFTPKRRGPGANDRNSLIPPADPVARPSANNPKDKPAHQLLQLTVTSSAVDRNGLLDAEYTCDGASASPGVEWIGAPAGTKSFAITLWHIASDQEKSYWVVYNIPAEVSKIEKNSKTIGQVGLNDKRKAAYEPMCSKGPGLKKYHVTVFALSEELKLSADQATRAKLLSAIKRMTLAEGTLDFQYERKK